MTNFRRVFDLSSFSFLNKCTGLVLGPPGGPNFGVDRGNPESQLSIMGLEPRRVRRWHGHEALDQGL